jgi:hypothetical protein
MGGDDADRDRPESGSVSTASRAVDGAAMP